MTKTSASVAWLFWLLVGFDAQAFYNPTTGRWLSRDPIGESQTMVGVSANEPANPEVDLLLFLGNDAVNSVDVLGLMLFANESCQDCNASFWWWSSVGVFHTPQRVPCQWQGGGSGGFLHGCFSAPGFFGLCNTETHAYIKAFNDTCCEMFRIECTWAYVGKAEGTELAKINVPINFLGREVRRIQQYASGPGGGTKTAVGVGGGWLSQTVHVPRGATVDVFRMQPRNFVSGWPNDIAEAGWVECQATCAE